MIVEFLGGIRQNVIGRVVEVTGSPCFVKALHVGRQPHTAM